MFPIIKHTWILYATIVFQGLILAVAFATIFLTYKNVPSANIVTPIMTFGFFLLTFWVSVSHLRMTLKNKKTTITDQTFS